MTTDVRSKNCVFLSHCLLAQVVRAQGVAKWPGSCTPVVQWCLDNDVNMIQMPCPEYSCAGMSRQTHGKKYYEEHHLRQKCLGDVHAVIEVMFDHLKSGHNILAIICVEFSPACSPNEGRSPYNPKGIFIEELQKEMRATDIRSIPFIGVSDRWLKRLDKDLAGLKERL